MQNQIDKLTNQEFVPKRRNQIFTSAKNRIDYHNKVAKELRQAKAFIEKPLQENHKILIALLNANETKQIEKKLLFSKGYNFNSFTHYENYNGTMCMALYNFIFIENTISNNTIKILRKQ